MRSSTLAVILFSASLNFNEFSGVDGKESACIKTILTARLMVAKRLRRRFLSVTSRSVQESLSLSRMKPVG